MFIARYYITPFVRWQLQSELQYERLRDTFVKSTGGGSDRGKEYDRMWDDGKRKVEKSKNDNATWLRGESDRMEVVPKLLPISEDIRVLLKHVKLDLRLNERASREEIRGEHSGWVPLANYRALLHNRLENIWFPVADEDGETTYKPRSFAKVNLNRAILGLAQENPQDPFRDYLLSLPVPTDPEKVEKLAMQFLTSVFGVAAGYDRLAAVGFRNLFRGIVWRTLEPGWKHDEMLILISPEGFGKSAMLANLVPDRAWFTDTLSLAMDYKQQVEQTLGKVIVECAELEGMTRGETTKMYAYLSRTDDFVRLSFREDPVILPRRFFIVGTTNRVDCLNFPTDQAGRRFVVVRLADKPAMNRVADVVAYTRQVRDTLWADAVYAVRNWRAPNWLEGEVAEEQCSKAKAHIKGLRVGAI